jgi:hypothetical protein
MNKIVIKEVDVRAAGKFVTVTLAFVPGDRFEITSTTGYRAELPACHCEDRTPCVKKACSQPHHCHGSFGRRHEEHALVLLDAVVKTYGNGLRERSDPSAGRTRLHRSYAYNGRVREVSVHEWQQNEWFASMEQVVETTSSDRGREVLA